MREQLRPSRREPRGGARVDWPRRESSVDLSAAHSRADCRGRSYGPDVGNGGPPRVLPIRHLDTGPAHVAGPPAVRADSRLAGGRARRRTSAADRGVNGRLARVRLLDAGALGSSGRDRRVVARLEARSDCHGSGRGPRISLPPRRARPPRRVGRRDGAHGRPAPRRHGHACGNGLCRLCHLRSAVGGISVARDRPSQLRNQGLLGPHRAAWSRAGGVVAVP